MIYTSTINHLPVTTADLICTMDGAVDNPVGWMWQALGYLVPGEIDHIVLYVGPGGRCIEAGAKGVSVFEVPNGQWDATAMAPVRWLLDTPIGVADPLAGRHLSPEAEAHIRAGVAQYCLAQAEADKPYNLNFFDPHTEAAFYCSQLVYQAYRQYGIDLTANEPHSSAPTEPPHLEPPAPRVIFPQVIWQNCRQRRFPVSK